MYAQGDYSSFLAERDLNRKASRAYDLYHYYIRHDLDSIKIASLELLLTDGAEKGTYARAMAERMLGAYMIRTGSIEEGLRFLNSAGSYFVKLEDHTVSSEIYNDIGHGYYLWAEYDEAIKSYAFSLRLGELAADKTSSFNAKLGMAKASLSLGDTIAGERLLNEYRRESLKLNKYEAAADASALLADLKMQQDNKSEGLQLMRESVRFSRRSGSEIHASHAYTNLGIVYFESDLKDSSLYYFKKALEIRQRLNNKKATCEALFNIADYYRMSGQPIYAAEYYRRSAALADSNSLIRDEIDALEGLLKLEVNETPEHFGQAIRHKLDSLRAVLNEKKGIDQSVLEIALRTGSGENEKERTSRGFRSYWSVAALIFALVFIFFFLRERPN